eukprot:672394-Pleurochrysis_carterae.AAC.1
MTAGRPSEAAAGEDVARARGGTQQAAWLAGDEGGPKLARRRSTQLSMLGLVADGAQAGEALPRTVARFAAAVAGEVQAADAVEAA